MITAQQLRDAGIEDKWPEIRAMVQHQRFYSFETSLAELTKALELLDMLPDPEELRLAMTGDEPTMTKIFNENPLIHALVHLGMQYERAYGSVINGAIPDIWSQPYVLVGDDGVKYHIRRNCNRCGGARRIVPRTGEPPTAEELAELTTMPCPECSDPVLTPRIIGGSGTRDDPHVLLYPEDEKLYEELHGAEN
jgi:hypothetical protein